MRRRRWRVGRVGNARRRALCRKRVAGIELVRRILREGTLDFESVGRVRVDDANHVVVRAGPRPRAVVEDGFCVIDADRECRWL